MLEVPMLVGEPRAQAALDAPAFHEWTLANGSAYARFHRQHGDYLVRFPGTADFEVHADGTAVIAFPTPGLEAETLKDLYLNQITPLALSLQGRLILHASAVLLDEACIAFAGRSGRGKSTLAATFSTSGYPFLTEDALHVDFADALPQVRPSHSSIRLWPDSRRALRPRSPQAGDAKLRHEAASDLPFHASTAPLRALFHLGPGDCGDVRIERISPNTAFIQVVQSSFILGVTDSAALASHFEGATRISALPIHYSLDFPRRFDMLPKVRDTIIAFARGEI
jgi:hypothetical protein